MSLTVALVTAALTLPGFAIWLLSRRIRAHVDPSPVASVAFARTTRDVMACATDSLGPPLVIARSEPAEPRAPFVCPRCGKGSWHPQDRAHGYCGRCHWWTGDPTGVLNTPEVIAHLERAGVLGPLD